MTKNVINIDDKASLYLEKLSKVLSSTLGPYGKTSIIEDHLLQHKFTKDGYTVLKSLYETEEIERVILQLVKNVSYNLVRKVGDGSTSAVVASNFLYKELLGIVNTTGIPPQDILNISNFLVEELIELIKQEATETTQEDLVSIAFTSTNGDQEVAELIKEVYEKIGINGIVRLEANKGNKTEFELNKGIELFRGFIDPVYSTEHTEKGMVCNINESYVFMCDDQLGMNELVYFSPLLAKLFDVNNKSLKTRNLVIVANSYDKTFLEYFASVKKQNPSLGICLVDFATNSEDQMNRFQDLAIFLGCNPHFKKSLGQEIVEGYFIEMLGYCKGFSATENRTNFIEGAGTEENLILRITDINKDIEELENNEDYLDRTSIINKYKARLASLSSQVATIYIGGSTDQEKHTKKYLIEDAVFACKSALMNNIVLGGNLLIPKIVHYILQDIQIINDDLRDKKVLGLFERLEEKFVDNKDIAIIAIDLLISFKVAFENVYEQVLLNKKTPLEKRHEIITNCVSDKGLIYNLRNDSYEYIDDYSRVGLKKTNVINSAETDIEILKTVNSILGLVATSNQIISIPKG
jgi:chaperonin GroEL